MSEMVEEEPDPRPWWQQLLQWFGSEQMAIDQCNHLLAAEPSRRPVVILRSQQSVLIEVVAPPSRPAGRWQLVGGKMVTFEDIAEFGPADVLVGYL